VLHINPDAPEATLIGDLCSSDCLPKDTFDCIILTETLFCIFDVRPAIANLVASLKPGGVMLITSAGIAQISRYDLERWGDYWRLTTMSLRRLLEEVVPAEQFTITSGGNVLAAVSLLHGIVVEDLTPEELDHADSEYEVTVLARVVKPMASTGS
jgi:SAM-dependent methyltransferase